jgi:hypothetical protein
MVSTIGGMADFVVPDDLAVMVSERRVIPFVGAGFSSGLGLPEWHELLRKVAEDIGSPVSYDEVRESCQAIRCRLLSFSISQRVVRLARCGTPSRSS